MTNEEIIKGLDNEALKNQGITAFEAMYNKITTLEKKLRDYEILLAKFQKGEQEPLYSECGWMRAWQVSKFLGYPIHRIYEMGYSKKLKTQKDGRSVIFFWDDVCAYKRRIEAEAGIIPNLKIIT